MCMAKGSISPIYFLMCAVEVCSMLVNGQILITEVLLVLMFVIVNAMLFLLY